MARDFQKASVGASGTRRLVPMMGIDFIAGNIELKQGKHGPYGARPASIGGRTRQWSNINFVQVNRAGRGRSTQVKASEIQARQEFATAVKSSAATVANVSVLNALMLDWRNGATYLSQDSNTFATMRGWVTAVRWAQIQNGIQITETTNTWPPQVQ